MDFIDLLQLVVYGLVLGSILTLGAIGVSLLFGILRFSNFAHGDIMTFGAYSAFVVVSVFHGPVWLALPVGMIVGALVAIAADQLVYRRLRRTQPVILLISSFGMALIIRSIIQLIWGPQDRSFVKGIQMPLHFGDIVVRPDHLWIFGGCIAIVVAVHLFLTYTKMGKAMRAMSDNMDLARVTGIDSEKVIICTWALGGALAAAAGVFLALDTRLTPMMGWSALLPIFAAAILGGFGKPYGAIVGGMVIGVVSELSTAVLPPAYKPAIAFTVMVIMLIVKPTGLLGARR
ncbi:MAG TPA: branched-chain amino acid ABC transporter permease [Candidatus Sulfotelmatobacter sp.]|jgi:branched-chain amino acid transport system permease protein/neutral amino acid transport system permease protein|nr:branched-chain amino acid ABC transporter permease [Candidatus Sulfotelmatobacter sp.]